MGSKIVSSTNLTNIANAIRANNKTNNKYTPANMATAINNLPYFWKGKGEELIKTSNYSLTLDDTSYSSWTPTTASTQAIKATEDLDTFVANMTDYDYIIEWNWMIDVNYEENTVLQSAFKNGLYCLYQAIFRRPSTMDGLSSKTLTTTLHVSLFTIPIPCYYSNKGVLTPSYFTAYGIYPTAAGNTISSASVATPTITLKKPAINVRCHNSYFSTDAASAVDTDKTTINCTCKVYQIPRKAMISAAYDEVMDLYNTTFNN